MRWLQSFGIKLDVLRFRIDAARRIGDDFTIHGNAARTNVLFAVPSGIDPRHGQKLLQSQLVG